MPEPTLASGVDAGCATRCSRAPPDDTDETQASSFLHSIAPTKDRVEGADAIAIAFPTAASKADCGRNLRVHLDRREREDLAKPGHVRFGLLSAQWSLAETALPTLATWSRTLNIVSWTWSKHRYAHSLVVRLDKRQVATALSRGSISASSSPSHNPGRTSAYKEQLRGSPVSGILDRPLFGEAPSSSRPSRRSGQMGQ